MRQLADYLGMKTLLGWITQKRYLEVVKLEHELDMVEKWDETSANKRSVFYPQWVKFTCPRDIGDHNRVPYDCDCQDSRYFPPGVRWTVIGGVLEGIQMWRMDETVRLYPEKCRNDGGVEHDGAEHDRANLSKVSMFVEADD